MTKKNIFSLKFLFLTIKATFKSVLYWKIQMARNFGRGRRAQNKLRSCSWIIIHGLTECHRFMYYMVWVSKHRGGPTWGRRGVTRIMLFTRRRDVLSLRSLPPMCVMGIPAGVDTRDLLWFSVALFPRHRLRPPDY